MKSYKRPYRVYYESWHENGEHKYVKTTGIPLDIAGYGRVMLRYRGNCIWNVTDYGTGLCIERIMVPRSEELYEYTKEYVLKVVIPNIMNYPHYRDKIRNAREKARQISLLRRYLDKEKYLMV